MSVAATIANTAVAGINALALAGAPTAVAQRAPSLVLGQTAPAIVVSVTKRGPTEYLCVTATGFADLHKYDGTVALITTLGDVLETNGTLEGWVESIRGALQQWATWTTALATFNDVTIGETQYYSRQAGDKTLNYCVQRFTVENKEAR